ncbi:MAG: hypothetical protein KJ970_20895 [Candidatus Eisenbacteria bacterium]|uniref:Uncharacterized protein n=1 Tax=Eiseniibacteriota bacterium TaxID=2212470 RepID=A0A948W8J1_UNCEI|nr:hypothetical protein [Candidatus Eisenbacteria bacterium]MBU2693385.1 hypothetical protein [Candidatus Eisenbacteria bacterium]
MDGQATQNQGSSDAQGQVLWCDPACDPGVNCPGVTFVTSAIRCLDQAVDGHPQLIVIHFGHVTIDKRGLLVELAEALKRNSHTSSCPVLALLSSRHRSLLESLEIAGVDSARYTEDESEGRRTPLEISHGLGADDRLSHRLEAVCPYLRYREIDADRELIVCGAYLDRMVLGGHRLRKICETKDHCDCQYYLNPRVKA